MEPSRALVCARWFVAIHELRHWRSAHLEAVGLVETNGCQLPLSQTHLVETTGMTDVHMNRSLNELSERGLIELRGKHLIILELDAALKATSIEGR